MYINRKGLKQSIAYLLDNFPAVVLVGARQVGKSTLLREMRPNAHFFDLENESQFRRVNDDPALLFKELSENFVFDEAQLSPGLFKALRVEIDRMRDRNGRFLLSGSSSPDLLKNITETLAGRIAILEIPCFEWAECRSIDQSLFYSTLESPGNLLELKPRYSHADIQEFCLYGGYPVPYLKRNDLVYYDLWYQNYVKNYVERDIASLFPTLNIDAYKRFIRMIASSTGEIINASNFARSLDVSQPTIKRYIEIIEGTLIWRKLLSYENNLKKRIVKMPRGHLKDTGLIHYFLNIHSIDELKGHHMYGRIWEGFIIEQLLRGLERNLIKHDAYFYRTHNQSEIDLIIDGRFGLIPIEIKSGSATTKKQLRILEGFVKENNCPYGILINNGDAVYRMTDRIIQIPAVFL